MESVAPVFQAEKRLGYVHYCDVFGDVMDAHLFHPVSKIARYGYV